MGKTLPPLAVEANARFAITWRYRRAVTGSVVVTGFSGLLARRAHILRAGAADFHPLRQQRSCAMVITMERPKVVFVRAYTRWRFRRNEHVCAHWRSKPHQLSFGF